MRVFLDANVLFSAAYRETGSVRAFFQLAAAGACTLVASGYAVEEARRNLAARHPARQDDFARLALEICPEPAPRAVALAAREGLPAKDAPILAAALESGCHVLVTGDRGDFGPLFGRRIRGTLVMLPVEAMELLLG